MKKVNSAQKELPPHSNKTDRKEKQPSLEIVVPLTDESRELMKIEARKPLYLTRYE